MLKMALTEKGIPLDGHYAIEFDRHLQQDSTPVSSATSISPLYNATQPPPSQQSQTTSSRHPLPEDIQIHEDGGIDL